MSKGGGAPTVSTYYVGIHFIACLGPVDKITEILVDQKSAWSGNVTSNTTIGIDAPELFGGNLREGGVTGPIDVLFGEQSQVFNPYLQARLPETPAYIGVFSIVLNHVYVGLNYYLKPWALRLTRVHKLKNGAPQWQDSYAEVGTDLINAVHVVRECCTDTTFGLGHASSLIDETKFLAAAQTCYSEGLGFAFYWNKESSISDFIQEVLKHIQGAFYLNRSTGKFEISLIRPVVSTVGLVHLTTANTKEVLDFKRKSIGDLVSQVTVKYIDNGTDKPASVTVTDAALAQRQGKVISKVIDYAGVATKDVAQKLSTRDLQQLSYPIYSCSIKCDRTAENLNPGDPFLLTWPDYFDGELLLRVVSINLGTAINNAITIEAIQDNFRATDIIYDSPPTTGWVSPIHAPEAVALSGLVETPYYVVATNKGDTFAQGVATTEQFISVFGASPTPDSISAAIWSTTGTTFVSNGVMDFCFSALLTTSIDRLTNTIPFISERDLGLLTVGKFIQIDNEIMGVVAIGVNSLTVTRGGLDTYPDSHIANARMYGWDDFSSTDQVTYLLTEIPKVKLLTATPKGILPIASAPQMSLTIAGRMHKAYPPGNLKINTVYWPTSVASTAGVVATKALIKANGSNGSTAIVDSSTLSKTVTVNGNAQISTAQSKFGGSSALFDGIITSFLGLPSSDSDFNLGTADFTIECWVYKTANLGTGSFTRIFASNATGSPGIVLHDEDGAGKLRVSLSSNGTTFNILDNAGLVVLPLTAWTHLAIVREGTAFSIFINGVKTALASSASAIYYNAADVPEVGKRFTGHIDDFRFTRLALYSANFAPPTAELVPIYNVSTTLTLTWASRNRLQQTASVIDYYAGNITSESGVTYSGNLKRADTSAILTSFSGETTLTRVLSTTYIGQVILEVWSVNANGAGNKVIHTFNIV